jgi:lysozyme family protein
MKSKWDCFVFTAYTLEGAKYSEDPNPTKFGCEQKEYDRDRTRQGMPVQSIKLIKDTEAYMIFDRNYWSPLRCNELSWPLNMVLFAFGLNLTTVAIVCLQVAVGAVITEKMDDFTMKAVKEYDPVFLAQKLLDDQRQHYKDHDKSIIKGLLARCEKTASFTGLT